MSGTDGISSLGKLLGSLSTQETPAGKTSAAAKPTAASVSRTQDQASVSAAGGLAAQAAGDSDVRLDKVTQLQQAIASGTYNVPSSAVASKLVDHLLGQQIATILEQATDALGALDAEGLECLHVRLQALLATSAPGAETHGEPLASTPEIAARYRVFAAVLAATRQNLAVAERVTSREARDAWAR